MKNRGFSLIEIVVAVAIMGILSGIVGLQLRSYIAKSKDTKTVATLNSFRVAAQLYQVDNEETLIDTASLAAYNEQKVKDALKKLEPYLDNNAKSIIEKPEMAVGGSRATQNGDIKYGGKVRITFIDPDGNSSDGYYMWLEPEGTTGAYDIKGNKWTEF